MTDDHQDVRDIVVETVDATPPITLGQMLACGEIEFMNLEAYGDIKSYSLKYDTGFFNLGEPKIVYRLRYPKEELVVEISLVKSGHVFTIPKIVENGELLENLPRPLKNSSELGKLLIFMRPLNRLTAVCTGSQQFNGRSRLYKEPAELIELKRRGKIFSDSYGATVTDRK